MPEIIIRIQVPEGFTVSTGGGAGGGGDRPFVPRPDPPFPSWDPACPTHDLEWKLVPAGTSRKSGKRYNAFWACPAQGCNEKPAKADEEPAGSYPDGWG